MRARRASAMVVLAVTVAGLISAGCGLSANAGGPGSTQVTVLAAASLTESFAALERRFETGHAGVDVRISYQGSATLAQQVLNGARADVFASADEATMTLVTGAALTSGPATVFATNHLAIAVAPGNPRRVTSLADLDDPTMTVVVCAPRVPCGAATRQIQQAVGVVLTPASEEPDVKAVLTKVRSGEADAGLVYATDIVAAGGAVTGVDLAEARNAPNRYAIATLRDAGHADVARAFVELVLGPTGREELARVGFGAP